MAGGARRGGRAETGGGQGSGGQEAGQGGEAEPPARDHGGDFVQAVAPALALGGQKPAERREAGIGLQHGGQPLPGGQELGLEGRERVVGQQRGLAFQELGEPHGLGQGAGQRLAQLSYNFL